MELAIQGSGDLKSEKDLELRCGSMGLNTKENGGTTRQTGRVFFIMLMVMFMMGSGEMIRLMGKEFILMQMERLTTAGGLTINKTDLE